MLSPSYLFDQLSDLQQVGSLCIPAPAFCFALLYLQSNLLPKSACSHICTLNLHVCQISSNYFFLLDIPLSVIRYIWAVYSATYAHGPDTVLLRLFLSPFVDITVSIFFLCLPLFLCILPFFYILVQIQYGIDISSLYALNYLCLFLSR